MKGDLHYSSSLFSMLMIGSNSQARDSSYCGGSASLTALSALTALTLMSALTTLTALTAMTAWSAAAELAWGIEVTWVVTSENELGVSVGGVDLYPGRVFWS